MSGLGIFFLAVALLCGALFGACIAGIRYMFGEAERAPAVLTRWLILFLTAVGLVPIAMFLFLAVIACTVAVYKLG